MKAKLNIAQVYPHPAQMRTVIGKDIAGLILSLHTNGWYPDRPLVVAPYPEKGEDQYMIVKGHRRALAWFILHRMLDKPDLASIGKVEEALAKLPENLIGLYERFQEDGTDALPEVMITAASYQQQILDLLADNFGGEAPDIAGLIHSLAAAKTAGASFMKIAKAIGRTETWVRNHIALLELPPIIQEAVAAGKWHAKSALELTTLPPDRKAAAERFYVSMLTTHPTSWMLTSDHVHEALNKLAQFKTPEPIFLPGKCRDYWTALAVSRAWTELLVADPAATWDMVMSNIREQHKIGEIIFMTVDETLVKGGEYSRKIDWAAVLTKFVPEVSCALCPLNVLRESKMRSTDFDDGTYPCFFGKSGPCPDAPIPPAPDKVKLPYDFPNLTPEKQPWTAAEAIAAWRAKEETKLESGALLPTSSNAEGSGGPIQKQRARIADFMARHNQLYTDHVLATPCERCMFRLEESPVKSDPNAPHCAWAARLKEIDFFVRTPVRMGRAIPVCRQFKTAEPDWSHRIPYWPTKPSLDRATMLRMIRELAADKNGGVSQAGRTVLECLTGRGKTKDENMSGAFAETLASQEEMLADTQLMYLLMLVYAEWAEHNGLRNDGTRYGEITYWLPDEGEYKFQQWDQFWQEAAKRGSVTIPDPVIPTL